MAIRKSGRDYAMEAFTAGTWCRGLGEGDPEDIKSLTAPTWLSSQVDPESLTVDVDIEWFGHKFYVSGAHLGPMTDGSGLSHRRVPGHHWELDWMGYEEGSEDPEILSLALPDVYRRLPSEGAWLNLGSWLLGAALVARLQNVRPKAADMAEALEANWPFFAAGFRKQG